MDVVKYEDEIYLADIIDLKEDASSVSYNRTYAFYDYEKIKALDGKVVTQRDIDRCVVFTKHITGTKLPFKEVEDLPKVRMNVEIVKVMRVEVAKPKTVYGFN